MTNRSKSIRRAVAVALFSALALTCRFGWSDTPAPPAPGPTSPSLDREAVYQSVLANYADPGGTSPSVHLQESKSLTGCRLERFTYDSTNGQTVPALLYIPDSATPKNPVPCVILLHGLGGSKEQMAQVGLSLTQIGYAALSIDEYAQGERSAGAPQSLDKTGVQTLLVKGVPQTVVDVRRGIDFLATRPEIDPSRTGLLGVSLGAIIGTVAAGVEPRIKTTVLISGGGDWGLILQAASRVGLQLGGTPLPNMQPGDWVHFDGLLAGVDPLTFAPHIAPRSLLMESGRLDPIITPQSTQELYDSASAPSNSNVHIDWYAQSGHVPDPALTAPVVRKWLSDHL